MPRAGRRCKPRSSRVRAPITSRRANVDVAVKRFLEAIEIDVTYGPAYLGLGAARERAGDAVEAERAYSMGIEHVNGFAEGRLARAHLRSGQHRLDEALVDLNAAADLRPEDLDILAKLRAAFITSQALPAALGVARRMIAVATAHADDKALGEARVGARALAALVKELDPVSAESTDAAESGGRSRSRRGASSSRQKFGRS